MSMNDRTLLERSYWDSAAVYSKDLRNEFICDWTVTDEQCIKAVLDGAPKNIYEVLEIGSGIGRLTNTIAKKYPSIFVYGVDISREMVEKASQTAPNNVQYFVNDGRTLPKIENLNFIYSFAVFQHIPTAAVHNYILQAGMLLPMGGHLRFQFIEGTESQPFSWHHKYSRIMWALKAGGFEVKTIDKDLILPRWTWITAVKQ